MSDADKVADRLERLLDVALSSLRDDNDEEAALLALQEALKTAQSLPAGSDQPICLPDLSTATDPEDAP